MAQTKIERKYLMHFVDAAFDPDGTKPNYVKLGADLEEYNEDLNPSVESKKNIWGETVVTHSGYEPQSDVDPYYATEGDPLYEKLVEIANERKAGDSCRTTVVDVLADSNGKVLWAYREDALVVPTSLGGDTSGVQIPFSIHYAGNRVKGTWTAATKTFTAVASQASAKA